MSKKVKSVWPLYLVLATLIMCAIGCFHIKETLHGVLNLLWAGSTSIYIWGISKSYKVNGMKDQLIETIKNKLHNVYPEFNSKVLEKQLAINKDTAECPWSKEELDAYREGMRVAYGQSRDLLIGILEEAEREPELEDYLSRPGAIFKIHETPTAMFMSLGIKNGQVVCCNGIDIKTGEVLKQMDGNAALPTIDEVEKYWEHFRKILK